MHRLGPGRNAGTQAGNGQRRELRRGDGSCGDGDRHDGVKERGNRAGSGDVRDPDGDACGAGWRSRSGYEQQLS